MSGIHCLLHIPSIEACRLTSKPLHRNFTWRIYFPIAFQDTKVFKINAVLQLPSHLLQTAALFAQTFRKPHQTTYRLRQPIVEGISLALKIFK